MIFRFPFIITLVFLGILIPLFPNTSMAHEGNIKTHKITNKIYMLESGSPGNIGVFVDEDGVILIDDQFAPLTNEIVAAIRKITNQEIRFLINTLACLDSHYPDHIGVMRI